MRIRPARPDEYDELGELVVAAYRGLPGRPPTAGYAAQLRDVRSRAAEAHVLVAEVDGTAVGCVTYVGDDRSPWAELLLAGEAGIRMLAVDPGRQRTGAGTALVAACVDLARASRRRRIVLSSLPTMTVAHRIYERLGFRRAPEHDWSPEAGIDLMAFVLDL